MQLFVLTQSNEADRLRRSGLQSLSQPTGLTALAAANPLVPARSKRAAASVAWVFVMASLTVQQGAMAIPVRLQPQVPAPAVMQLVPGKAETPKRHTALLSTHKKSKAVQEAHNQSEASAGLDFFQLAQSITSDIEDNSSDIYPYITPALLENNTAALYHQVTANNTVDAIGQEKQQLADKENQKPSNPKRPTFELLKCSEGSAVRAVMRLEGDPQPLYLLYVWQEQWGGLGPFAKKFLKGTLVYQRSLKGTESPSGNLYARGFAIEGETLKVANEEYFLGKDDMFPDEVKDCAPP